MGSKLVTMKIMSPNNSGRRTYNITRISPHCMVGELTAKRCGELFLNPGYMASSNYGIGTGGEIALYVGEENRSWCSSSADNDNRAITIECASGAKSPYAMNSRVYASLVSLCVDICRRYGKNRLLWLGDRETSLRYKPKANEMILTVHRWFAAKSCPGDWLYKRMGALAEAVTKQLQVSAVVAPAQKEEPNSAAAVLIDNEEADRERRIWAFFAGKGLSPYAIAGLMGNLYAESALRPNNLQNSFERKLKMTDKGYTAVVNSGTYTNFVNDGAGYGLAQWTYHTRKKALLKYAQAQKKSIDDLGMQLDFLWQELQGYRKSMAALRAGTSIKTVSDAILTDFEKPADQSAGVKNRRANLGREIYDRQAGAGKQPEDTKKAAFTLQIGAFSAEENAEKRRRQLENKGVDARIVKRGNFWKVWAGEFETAAEASAGREALRKKKVSAVIVEV